MSSIDTNYQIISSEPKNNKKNNSGNRKPKITGVANVTIDGISKQPINPSSPKPSFTKRNNHSTSGQQWRLVTERAEKEEFSQSNLKQVHSEIQKNKTEKSYKENRQTADRESERKIEQKDDLAAKEIATRSTKQTKTKSLFSPKIEPSIENTALVIHSSAAVLPIFKQKNLSNKLENLKRDEACKFYLNQEFEQQLKQVDGSQKSEEYKKLIKLCVMNLDEMKGNIKKKNKVTIPLREAKADEILQKHFRLVKEEIIPNTSDIIEVLAPVAERVCKSTHSSFVIFGEQILCEFYLKTFPRTKGEINLLHKILKSSLLHDPKKKLFQSFLDMEERPQDIKWLEVGCFLFKQHDANLDKQPEDIKTFNLIAMRCLLVWLEKFKNPRATLTVNSTENLGLKILEDIAAKSTKEVFEALKNAFEQILFEKIYSEEVLELLQDVYYSILYDALKTKNSFFEKKQDALFFFCDNIHRMSKSDCSLLKSRFNEFLYFSNFDVDEILQAIERILENASLLNRESASLILDSLFSILLRKLPRDIDLKRRILTRMFENAVKAKNEFGFVVNQPRLLGECIKYIEVDKSRLIKLMIDCLKKNPDVSHQFDLYGDDECLVYEKSPSSLKKRSLFRECISKGMDAFETFSPSEKQMAFLNFLDLCVLTLNENEKERTTKVFADLVKDVPFLLGNFKNKENEKNKAFADFIKVTPEDGADYGRALSNVIISTKEFWNPKEYWPYYFVFCKIEDPKHGDLSVIDDMRDGLIQLVDSIVMGDPLYERYALHILDQHHKEFVGHYPELLRCYQNIFSCFSKKKNQSLAYDRLNDWLSKVDWSNFPIYLKECKKDFLKFLEDFVSTYQKSSSAVINTALENGDFLKELVVVEWFFVQIIEMFGKKLFEINDEDDWNSFKKISEYAMSFNKTTSQKSRGLKQFFVILKETISRAKYQPADKDEFIKNLS